MTPEFDSQTVYREMLRSRLFETAVKELWDQGLISGEMHMGMGEEALVAGIVMQLQSGDALALDHRGTPPLVMRGVDLTELLFEFMGKPGGLCKGMGGHMHLFAPDKLAASSGIVGSAGPAAAGFALSGQLLRPGAIAVGFFGEGAMNQGMLMESFNLALAWNLPVLFVCKDNGWQITTQSEQVIAGDLTERARGFGLHTFEVDGLDAAAVWDVAGQGIQFARTGNGPSFIHATCIHIEGHYLGDPLLRIASAPVREMAPLAGPLTKGFFGRSPAPLPERIRNLLRVSTAGWKLAGEEKAKQDDPLLRARANLTIDQPEIELLESEVEHEIQQAVATALAA